MNNETKMMMSFYPEYSFCELTNLYEGVDPVETFELLSSKAAMGHHFSSKGVPVTYTEKLTERKLADFELDGKNSIHYQKVNNNVKNGLIF